MKPESHTTEIIQQSVHDIPSSDIISLRSNCLWDVVFMEDEVSRETNIDLLK